MGVTASQISQKRGGIVKPAGIAASARRTGKSKHERAKVLVEDLWRQGSGVVSTQVLQELCVDICRKAKHPVDLRAAREIVTDYLSWGVVTNTGEYILDALHLEEQYQISFWDALIVQAAEASGAVVLYSEDLSDGQTYRGVRVVNPLRRAE